MTSMKLMTLVILSSFTHLVNASYLAASQATQSQLEHNQNTLPQAPSITPFAFNANVQETQRYSVLCTISSGDLPVSISWLKDGQLLTAQVASARRIVIKPDSDQSTLKFGSVRLDHAGNYTCIAKNQAGQASHSAQLIVHGEPRWLREPMTDLISTTRGQTVVIDCQTTGWPKPNQTWWVKTHNQNEFEPLTASGRISLVSNGSLLIRSADKSDEANYLCRSSNGIGRQISWSTSLKVNVPAHFEPNGQQTNLVRRQSQVQLRCDAHGDEPLSIEWYRNKQRVTGDSDTRYTIHNQVGENTLISMLMINQAQRKDNALYECIARNQAGRDRLPIELLVQEEPDNIQEIQASHINSRSVTLVWSEPYDGRSPITNYMFQYKKIQDLARDPALNEMDFVSDSDASLGVASKQTIADDWQQALRIQVPVHQANNSASQVRSYTIDRLDPSTKYVIRALAVNSIGQSKFSQPMEFTTEEEAPETGPANVRAKALNSTSILVSWDELPKSKHLGRVLGYYVGYRVANSTGQNFVLKPYVINDLLQQNSPQTQNPVLSTPGSIDYATPSLVSGPTGQRLETVLHDLRRDTMYEITVNAFNGRGSGPARETVTCRTIEMEAPKAVKLQIRRESNESIIIEWHRDPTDQNPVDDYILFQEKNSASQEWLQVRLPGNQTHYKTPGLKCGTRYQFYIVAQNKVGKSKASDYASASTIGALPVIPTKTSLMKMINSTCLLLNLNSFQDNGCRIKTFTVQYRIEKSSAPNGSTLLSNSNGLPSQHQAQSMNGQLGGKALMSSSNGQIISDSSSGASDWITVRPKSNPVNNMHLGYHHHNGHHSHSQRFSEEDRTEYLCDLNPTGEYTIHVTATNDVGRSEIEYTVSMSSDELRYSFLRELTEMVSGLPNFFAYIPSLIVFLLAGLFVCLVALILYTTVARYYQKFVIIHNQIRATRRAKRDEKRRRKLNGSHMSQKVDLWADDYDDDDEDGDDEDEDEDQTSSQSASTTSTHQGGQHRQARFNHQHANMVGGHYLTNIASSAFDTSSIDSRHCNGNKCSGASCISTASTESIHGRFHGLNSKQYVKMNEYSMLPSISASLGTAAANDIYGTTNGGPQSGQNNAQPNSQSQLYYSTLRRTSMQTYIPQHQQQRIPQASLIQTRQSPQQQHHQHQHHRRVSQNMGANDIYGYYVSPKLSPNGSPLSQSTVQQQQDEVANSIFVPPQQIIYSAPNIRRPPVFL